MRLEHQHVRSKFILHRFSKMTIMFFTDLGLMRFKSHVKAKTLTYLPTKIHKFWLGRSLPVLSQKLSCFSENSSLTVWVCSLTFHTNPQLKPFLKSMQTHLGPSQHHTKTPHSISLHIHIQ